MKIILAILLAVAAPAWAVETVTPYEAELIAATNAARVANGLKPVEADPAMMAFARRHTIRMGTGMGMRHASGPYAENIAHGQSSGASVIRDWLQSPGHRRNMLNPSHTKIGISGYTIGRSTWWTQEFGR